MRRTALLATLFLVASTFVTFGQSNGYPYKSFADFRNDINRITNISDPADRDSRLNEWWDMLKSDNQIPFRIHDSVAFLFRGKAGSVSWAGDFNGWKPGQTGYEGVKSGLSDIWIAVQHFPGNARLDYKIIVDDQWILDPENPYQQMGGMGENSVLRMPGWRYPDETELASDVIRGELSDNRLIKSEKLGYSVNYRVYTPYNYAQNESLPVLYVTDGQDYADDAKGALVIILDNLIYSGEMKPVIAVFVDPREPGKEAVNRRMKEYNCNQEFADFLDKELLPLIDQSYKTHDCPDDRGILGTSVGAINSAWLGAVKRDRFHILGMQSPAFNKTVLDTFGKLDWFPFHVYMTTGVFNDTQEQALKMKKILEDNQVDFEYREVNEGRRICWFSSSRIK